MLPLSWVICLTCECLLSLDSFDQKAAAYGDPELRAEKRAELVLRLDSELPTLLAKFTQTICSFAAAQLLGAAEPVVLEHTARSFANMISSPGVEVLTLEGMSQLETKAIGAFFSSMHPNWPIESRSQRVLTGLRCLTVLTYTNANDLNFWQLSNNYLQHLAAQRGPWKLGVVSLHH